MPKKSLTYLAIGGLVLGAASAGLEADAEPATSRFANPIVPGYAPDPSICRVGDDFYLVNSSFTMLPGLPIYHSRDLVSWRLVGHAIAKNDQASFVGSGTNGGIYAPTLRHHAGRFWLIVKNTTSGHNELYTTLDPAGRWDGPTRVGPDWDGDIDPDLFFDSGGGAYVARRIGIGDGSKAEQFAWRFDPSSARVTSERFAIWPGTGRHVWPEGGHLYRVGGFYYYLLAEGGTGPDHRATIARKPVGSGLDDATQTWETCPQNPILFNDPKLNPEITCTGHVDLIDDAAGNWWAVFLAQRPTPLLDLGRETYLAPVTWRDGWPIVNEGKPITREMTTSVPLPGGAKATPISAGGRVEFDGPTLPIDCNFLRKIEPATFSLVDRPGSLTLRGTRSGIATKDVVAWVGRRLIDKSVRVTTSIDFAPAEDQSAGLNLFATDESSVEFVVRRTDEGREATVRINRKAAIDNISSVGLPDDGEVRLELAIRDERIVFRASADDGKSWAVVADVAAKDAISFPGFAGVYVGLHAVGEGATARFDWFEYEALAR